MKLIVGLGNPGKEYENTRHNIGFMCIDHYLETQNIKIQKEKFNGKYVKLIINNEPVIFLKPQSYMNLSGEVILKFVNFYKIDIKNLLVIYDDMDTQVGAYKLKVKGSSAGHNGLRNIELNLKTQEYKRLKIGISKNKNINAKDYVLGRIEKENMEIYNNIFKITNNIIDDFINVNFDSLMNKYNHK